MTENVIDILSSSTTVKVLLIDHGSGSLSRIHELLGECTFPKFYLDCVTSLPSATNKFLGNSHDICLIDSAEKKAAEFLTHAKRVGCTFPAIAITDDNGSEILEAIHAGAADCLLRDNLCAAVLDQTICRVIEQHRIEATRIENETRYLGLIENAKDIIYTHDLSGNYKSANKAAETLTGYSHAEIMNLNARQVVAEEFLEMSQEMVGRKLHAQKETSYELEMVCKDGHRVPVEVNTHLIYSAGRPVAVQGIARDITQRLNPEVRTRQAEKPLAKVVTSHSHLVSSRWFRRRKYSEPF